MIQHDPKNVNPESPTHSKIEVISIAPARYGYGAVKAFARVKIGALVISNVKVIQQAGQRAYVRLPDQQNEATGKWFPIVNCLSPTLEAAISGAVIEAWQAREAQP